MQIIWNIPCFLKEKIYIILLLLVEIHISPSYLIENENDDRMRVVQDESGDLIGRVKIEYASDTNLSPTVFLHADHVQNWQETVEHFHEEGLDKFGITKVCFCDGPFYQGTLSSVALTNILGNFDICEQTLSQHDRDGYVYSLAAYSYARNPVRQSMTFLKS